MKIYEITNPEEQLGLLRIIIDNTWSAIKQQADTNRLQKASKPKNKPIYKAPKPPPAPQPKKIIPRKLNPITQKVQNPTPKQTITPKPPIQSLQYPQQRNGKQAELGSASNEKFATKNYDGVLIKSST
jgi:hypothetical protein